MFLYHVNQLNEHNIIPLDHNNKKWTLTKHDGGYSQTSNVCPHQNSLIVTEPCNEKRRCMYHGWSWDESGNPTSSGTTASYCQNTNTLKSKPVYEFKHMLFENPVDEMPELDFLDFSYMELEEYRIDRVKSNYVNIMNIFLDQDHIPVTHEGLYDKIGIPSVDDLEWVYKDNSSIQLTHLVSNDEASQFLKTLRPEDSDLKYGSAWIAIYPYTMIEWQPGALINTVMIPLNDNETDVLVYKHRDSRYTDDNWKFNSMIWEEAWRQDKEQSERMVGVSVKNLEQQKEHFRNWVLTKPSK